MPIHRQKKCTTPNTTDSIEGQSPPVRLISSYAGYFGHPFAKSAGCLSGIPIGINLRKGRKTRPL